MLTRGDGTSDIATVYVDGGVIERNPSAKGGTYAWCCVARDKETITIGGSGAYLCQAQMNAEEIARAQAHRFLLAPVTIPAITNNLMEYMAACVALSYLPERWAGKFYSDSQITLGRMFWGWATNGLPDAWVRRAGQLRARLGVVTPILLQGHPTEADLKRGFGAKRGYPVSKFNVWCDEKCAEVSREVMERVFKP